MMDDGEDLARCIATAGEVIVLGCIGGDLQRLGYRPLVGLGDVVDGHEVGEEAKERGQGDLDRVTTLVGCEVEGYTVGTS